MLKNCRKVFREPMNKILERCQIVSIIIPCKMIVLIPFNFFALKEVRDMLMRELFQSVSNFLHRQLYLLKNSMNSRDRKLG